MDNQQPIKNHQNEFRTFPVQFALAEIKENISISTETSPKHSKEQLLNLGLKFHKLGNILEAKKYYKYFINEGFLDSRVFSNYAIILNELGKSKEAENYILKAIEINPNSAIAYSNRGNILSDLGNLNEAELSIRKAIEIKPNFAQAHSNLSRILIELGRSKEAELSIRKAIEIKPDLSEAHSNLGIILKDLGNLKEAELSIRKSIELNPSVANAHLNLGAILIELGKLKEAEFATRLAIKQSPNSADAYLNLGEILSSQYSNTKDLSKLKEAEIMTKKAINLEPSLTKAYINLGEISYALGKPEEASIHEWNAIRFDPSFTTLKIYRENAKVINKTSFFIFSYTIFNHYRPIIEINSDSFEILVPDNFDKEMILKIKNDLANKNVRIRSCKELIKNNLFYKRLISNHAYHKIKIKDIHNQETYITVPIVKLLGKENIRLMYAAGKMKWNLSYWNKYYDGILCYGPYHENKFKIRHRIHTAQMGYPRFDKYFKPGFKKNSLLKKFNCDPKKKTIVWLTTWKKLSSVGNYYKAISALRSDHNIVVRPHPSMKKDDPENYKKLYSTDFNYVDDNSDDNVQLFALSDLMVFDYGGSMFGALYLNKNFLFLDMNLESKNNRYLGDLSSEDYLKSFFPDRIATPENLKSICNYCLNNPPHDSIVKGLREEFFNTNYQGTSANRAYELLTSSQWLK